MQQQNPTNENSAWTLFGKSTVKDKTGEETLKDIFQELLDIKLSLKNINEIYSYFSKELNKDTSIYYAEVKKLHKIKQCNTM